MPWVSTLTAATTVVKMLELGTQNKEKDGDYLADIQNRITVIEAELETERKKVPAAFDRVELRRGMSQLDAKLVQAQTETAAARAEVNRHFAAQQEVRSTQDEVARLIQQLRDERAAGYMFRQLRPVCCPACEADFQAALVAPNDETCPLCKNELPIATGITDERLEVSEQNLKDVNTVLKSTQLALKVAEKLLAATDARKQEIEANLAAIQVKLVQQSEDGELRIVELNATIKELKNLLGENIIALKPAENPDKRILEDAVKMTKAMFDDLQRDVLKDVSAAIKRLAVKFGVVNVAEMTLNGGGQLRIVQGGADTSFTKLTPGERLRVKIAAALAAVEVARLRGLGRHPGLLLLDSPGAEEVVSPDFHQMLLSVATVAKEMGGVQIIIGTVYRPELEGIVPSKHRKYAENDSYLF